MSSIPSSIDEGQALRRCPVCGQAGEVRLQRSFDPSRVDANTFSSRKRPELMHWTMAECVSCDLLFALDPPGLEALRDAYVEAAFDAGRESIAAARTYEAAVRGLVLDPSGWPAERLQVLDVGCGDGAFLMQMQGLGASRTVGIEISEEPIRRAPAEIRGSIECCMIEEYEGRNFTLATTFQVLEHFAEPLRVMTRLRESLVPGGLVMGVVHDRRALANRILGLRSPIWDVEHLQLFSPKSVRALVEASGLRFVGMRHITNAYPIEYWLRLAPVPTALRPGLETIARLGGRELTLPLRVGNLAFVAQNA